MLRSLLICGLLAGLCGGVLLTGFALLAGEEAVDHAIAFEAAQSRASGVDDHVADPAPVSRTVQKTAGLLTAAVVYGMALGGLFALAFAFIYGRVGRASPRVTAYWLAAGAFVVVYLVPFIKYPASPPSVGQPETVGQRTALYVIMVAISILAAIAAGRLRPALIQRLGSHGATLAALVAYVGVIVGAGVALPGIHEVPATFPATTLWRFREASVGMQAVLWTTIGVIFASTARRIMTGQPILSRHPRASGPAPAGASD